MLERNPYGKVPVLEDDGVVVYESAIIDEYLEEKYPAVCLMPKDLAERARVRIWVDYCNTRLQRAGGFVAHDYKVEESKAEIVAYLKFLDNHLRGRDYLAGAYSLADITFIPFFYPARALSSHRWRRSAQRQKLGETVVGSTGGAGDAIDEYNAATIKGGCYSVMPVETGIQTGAGIGGNQKPGYRPAPV